MTTLLTEPQELQAQLRAAITKYRNYRWSVAWASFDFPLYRQLVKRQSRVAQLVVGTHFYQTHPDFLAAFSGHQNFRVVLLPSGVFHPKVYLFENSATDWVCFAGSPNFSAAAFSRNVEFTTQFDSTSPNATELYQQIRGAIDSHWRRGAVLTPAALARYRVLRQHYRPRLRQMAAEFGARPDPKPPIEIEMFGWDWPEFVRRVRNDPRHDFSKRLAVLAATRKYFQGNKRFQSMSQVQRERIAGFAPDEDALPWRYFGSMFPAGLFKQAVRTKIGTLSRALEMIPLRGEVTRSDYDRYIAVFRKAFPHGGDGVGGATRLLCMKRPDLFLCVNSKNRIGLSRALNIPKAGITYESYWEEIIERIQATAWWNTPEPGSGVERDIWQGRTALLDALYYDPSSP